MRGIVSMCNLQNFQISKQNEATRTVKVAGIDTVIKTITVEDNDATIDVTLWRGHAEKHHHIGNVLR